MRCPLSGSLEFFKKLIFIICIIYQFGLYFNPIYASGGGFTNGSSDGRSITEITRKGLNKAPECFPNPVTDELSIQLQLLNDGPVTIQIYDGMGKMMMAENFLLESGTEQLQLRKVANWANGIYHYAIYVDGIPYHGTFLKAGN